MADTMELLVRAPGSAPQRENGIWSLIARIQSSTRVEGPWARAAAMQDAVQYCRDDMMARHGYDFGL